MRPLEGVEHVWHCDRHLMFAQLVDKETAASYERGDPYVMLDGSDGLFVGHGDERQGGELIYFRAK